MEGRAKSRQELIEENTSLRKRVAELEERLAYQDGDSMVAPCHGGDEILSQEPAVETRREEIPEKYPGIGHVGGFMAALDRTAIIWSDETCRIFGYEPGDVTPSWPMLIKHIHPEDLPRFLERNEALYERGEAYEVIYRIIRADGGERTVRSRASVEPDASGKAGWVHGALVDITGLNGMQKNLRKSDDWVRFLFHNLADPVFILDSETSEFTDANEKALQRYGYTLDEIRGMTPEDIEAKALERDIRVEAAGTTREEQRHFRTDHVTKKGDSFPVEVTAIRVELDGRPLFLSVCRDISEHLYLESALEYERDRFYELLDNLPGVICVYSKDYKITFTNKLFKEYYGDPGDEPCYRFFYNREKPCELCRTFLALKSRTTIDYELEYPKDHYLHLFNYPMMNPDGTAMVLELGIDITIRKRTEQELRRTLGDLREKSLEIEEANRLLRLEIQERELVERDLENALQQKEVLLREVHHRVKNNLQIILSLLDLQQDSMADFGHRAVFEDMGNRVKAMALVHDTLCRSDDLSKVELARYTSDLAMSLSTALSMESARVKITLELDQTELHINQALPFGLIINELITNSLKHAFPNGGGQILIRLENLGQEVQLTIKDDGVGLPHQWRRRIGNGLGLSMVNGLVNLQLHGTLETRNDCGACFTIRFRKRASG